MQVKGSHTALNLAMVPILRWMLLKKIMLRQTIH